MIASQPLLVSLPPSSLPLLQHRPQINLISPSPAPLRMQPPVNLGNLLAVNTRLSRLPFDPFLGELDVDHAVDDRVRDVHALRAELFGEADG